MKYSSINVETGEVLREREEGKHAAWLVRTYPGIIMIEA